jgi:hypothetical protein
LKDLFNGDLSNPNHVLIEYRIGKKKYGLFTVEDLVWFNSLAAQNGSFSTNEHDSNLVGRVSERLAWRITHYWLENFSDEGNITSRDYDEGHIFANSTDYILKVKNSPNLVLLEKSVARDTNYKVWTKEIDGIFEYSINNEKYVFVLETKTDGLSIDKNSLEIKLFEPLNEIYPDARIIYVLFSSMSSIYEHANSKEKKNGLEKRLAEGNLLKQEPAAIYEMLRNPELMARSVGTMFFGFRESSKDLSSMVDHIIKHTNFLNDKEIPVSARLSKKTLTVYMGPNCAKPALILKRKEGGSWEEKPISW